MKVTRLLSLFLTFILLLISCAEEVDNVENELEKAPKLTFTKLTINKSITTIRKEAFRYCTSLTSITLPESLTIIEQNTFYNCTNLASITLPNSLTTIGQSAFYNCQALTSITLPESVTTIGDRVFYNTNKVTVTIKQTNLAKITLVHTQAFDDGVLKIKVPSGSLPTYKADTTWKKWKDKMVGY